MKLTFGIGAEYAGQDFTPEHQKANGAYEYFYDTADSNGDLIFGPLYELSPFMIVKGTLTKEAQAPIEQETDVEEQVEEEPTAEMEDIPKTGENAQPAVLVFCMFIAAAGLAAFALRKRERD